MSNNYGNDSIKSLGILGGVRAKPASIGIENHNHTFIEILANSIDEAEAGHGDKIIVTKNIDNSIAVRDFGRGVPMGKNKDGEYSYKKIFDELFAGGKYDNNDENINNNYVFSLGTNGLGACATNYTSDFFKVKAFYSNNKSSSVNYEKGIEVQESYKEFLHSEPVGTSITWLPSTECFRGKGEIDDDFIHTTLKDQSIVNGGLKFIYINKKTLTEDIYYYERGISEYVESISTEENRLTDVVFVQTEQKGNDTQLNTDNEEKLIDYKIKAEIYFSFNRSESYNRYYHNTSWLEDGGTPEEFIKNSFTYVVDKFLKEQNLYNKGEKKISFDDISDSLIIVTSTYSTISLFTGQSKKKISSDFMKRTITKWLREQLEIYFIENPQEMNVVLAQVLVNKRSREKAEKTRLDIKKKLSGTVNNLTARVDGFVNCKSKDNKKTEFFIVEGKSALGSTQQGRDKEFQAIYAIRGKIINCLKKDYDKIFKSDVVIELIKLLGCGVEVKNKNAKDLNSFNIENLRWNKIIITTDADVDGFHIRTLLLTLFYKLMPSLIEQGFIYIAESPLYELIDKKDESHFAYTDKEKDSLLQELGNNVVSINRSKGLGENTAQMMWDTTMNPETRRLVPITIDEVEAMKDTFDLFLGDNLAGRKEYIEEHLHEYLEEALV